MKNTTTHSRKTAGLRNLNKWAAATLMAAALLCHSTQVQAAPDEFTVRAPANGKVFKLSEAKGKFVALHFLLKTECPYCLRHTHEYAMKAASTPNVEHLFLKPDGADEIKAWSEKANTGDGTAPVAVYQDEDAKLATAFNIPDGYQFHGQTVHYPALVLLNKEGKEVFRYVGKNNSDRLPYDQFTAKMAELGADAGVKPENIAHYNIGPDKLALEGHDPVSYFTAGKAAKGKAELGAVHNGVTYQFASEENRTLFKASPAKYLPAYGGWCATAMAKGEKVEIDPANFKITNGRLFLFFKAFYANAIKDWNKDEPGLTTKADANWSSLQR